MKATFICALMSCSIGTLIFSSGCGTERPRWSGSNVTKSAIYYGEADSSEAHKAVVAITDRPFSDIVCTGTLIAPKLILTAAHCVRGRQASRVEIHFGPDAYAASATVRTVSRLKGHAGFSPTDYGDDIGLIWMQEKAPAGISPIPFLPSSKAISEQDTGAEVDVSGYGYTQSRSYGNKRHRKVDITVVCFGTQSCVGLYMPGTFGYDQYQGGPCVGDSGGPAFMMREGTEYVAGISSYGDSGCQDYGASTIVSHYADWLLESAPELEGTHADEICDNRFDDDDDGDVDCADDDCDDAQSCQTTVEDCGNNTDDDNDGYTDCDDSDCDAAPSCEDSTDTCPGGDNCVNDECTQSATCSTATEICDNNTDDDEDGATDCDDADCANRYLCNGETREFDTTGCAATAQHSWTLLVGVLALVMRRRDAK